MMWPGHAYAAVISACAAGRRPELAVSFFKEMVLAGIEPDVVSCTALISALASDGRDIAGMEVIDWMLEVCFAAPAFV